MVETDSREVLGASPSRVLLLAGGISRPPVVASSGTGLWSLALTRDRTLLDVWVERLHGLVSAGDGGVRMLLDREPCSIDRTFMRCRGVEPWADREPYRGPAGAIRDASVDLDADAVLLVAELSRCPLCPLEGLLRSHEHGGHSVTVSANPDGSPGGVYVVTAGALSNVAPRGYADIKEQWLPTVRSGGGRVGVHRLAPPGTPSVRTPGQLAEVRRELERRGEVVVRRFAPSERSRPPGVGVPRETDRGDGRASLSETGDSPIRTRPFPDGSIKACQKVVDGSATGNRALSDESGESPDRPAGDG